MRHISSTLMGQSIAPTRLCKIPKPYPAPSPLVQATSPKCKQHCPKCRQHRPKCWQHGPKCRQNGQKQRQHGPTCRQHGRKQRRHGPTCRHYGIGNKAKSVRNMAQSTWGGFHGPLIFVREISYFKLATKFTTQILGDFAKISHNCCRCHKISSALSCPVGQDSIMQCTCTPPPPLVHPSPQDLYRYPPEGDSVRQMQANQPLNPSRLLSTPSPNTRTETKHSGH